MKLKLRDVHIIGVGEIEIQFSLIQKTMLSRLLWNYHSQNEKKKKCILEISSRIPCIETIGRINTDVMELDSWKQQ